MDAKKLEFIGSILFSVGFLLSLASIIFIWLGIGIVLFLPAIVFLIMAWRKRAELTFPQRVWTMFFLVMSCVMAVLFIWSIAQVVVNPPQRIVPGSCPAMGGFCVPTGEECGIQAVVSAQGECPPDQVCCIHQN